MAEKGRLQIRTYASNMLIPVQNSSVTVTTGKGEKRKIIAFRMTDENGLTEILNIDTPPFTDSQTDNSTDDTPFAVVDVLVEKENYSITIIRDVQIFSNRLSEQNVEMIPMPQNSDFDLYSNVYTVTPQNLWRGDLLW